MVKSIIVLSCSSGRLRHEPDILEAHCRDYNILSGFILIDHNTLVLRQVFRPGFSPFSGYTGPQVFRNFGLKPSFVGLHGYEMQSPFSPVFYHFIQGPRSPGTDIDTLRLKHLQEFAVVIRNSGDLIPAFIHCFEKIKHALGGVEVICRYIVFSRRVIVIDDSYFLVLIFF